MSIELPNGSSHPRFERLEKLLGLLVDHHVTLQSHQHDLLKSEAMLTEQISKLTRVVESVVRIVENMTEAQQFIDKQVGSLVDEISGLKELVKELSDSGSRTDRRLNALITLMEGRAAGTEGPDKQSKAASAKTRKRGASR